MNDFTLSLQISALGMSLVFGVILLLWLMMVILTAVTAEKESPVDGTPASDSPEPAAAPRVDSKLQVALLAVAMALAEQESTAAHPLSKPPTAIISAWQLGTRTRQMSEKGNLRKHRNEI